ncbi:hypothetical protein MY04_0537 [Flammeovirga sp. MY04]|uniref:hypothetical protein n=1 Tax=Flammeovirga sp. MY04 TaxID=1191459 RepID=UPI0008062FBA|nr:hypothetical protein [Flammeovirga sp. MY04]ANQ47919.1 hypothetical protein MY04_0537 [Flammeovirga sp. MY04]
MWETFDIQSLFFGLLAGLAVALVVQVKGWFKQAYQNKEIKRLKSHLHDKMEIDAEAMSSKKGEIERLKRENENLRVTNKALMNKPGRQEMMTYHAFQIAIDKLNSNMMGFGPAWQDAFKEAKEDVKSIEEGEQSFMKKVLPKGLFGGNTYELGEGDD